MSRKDFKTEYLSLEDGQRIQAETLKEAIEQNPNIKTVVLFWTWTQDYYTSNAGPFEAYVTVYDIDQEYSFQGGREDALKFADSYDCWDGEGFIILKGDILYGYVAREDNQTSWNDGYDHINGIGEGIDPSWIQWIRVDFDYENGIEYLLSPDPFKNRKVTE